MRLGFDFSPKGSFIGSQSKHDGATAAVYELVRSYGDVIGGIFCGHHHNDMYTEILTSDGGVIPQYILTACPYDGAGHVIRITVE